MAYREAKAYGSASYHGMKVGGLHHWTYPDGDWTERKVAPDQWELNFTSLKRRKDWAPAGSGADIGSGYHWLVVAHQWVEKLDANTYATQMEGRKLLLSFRKPEWPVWNTQLRKSKRGAKERTIAALQAMIRAVEESDEDFEEVVDEGALVDLAATFEAEEGLPVGTLSVPYAQRLADRLHARVAKKEKETGNGDSVKARPRRNARPRRAHGSRPAARSRSADRPRRERQVAASRSR